MSSVQAGKKPGGSQFQHFKGDEAFSQDHRYGASAMG
jgi:hypothetical protein